MDNETKAFLEQLLKEFSEFRTETNQKFDKLETKIDSVNDKMDSFEKRVMNQFKNLENRFEDLEARNGTRHIELQAQLNKIEDDVSKNVNDITALKKAK